MIVFFALLIVIVIIAASSTRDFAENSASKRDQMGNGQMFYIDGKGRARMKGSNQHVTVRNGEIREIGTGKVLYNPMVSVCDERNQKIRRDSLGKWSVFRGKYMSRSDIIKVEKSTGKPYILNLEYDGKTKSVRYYFYYVTYSDNGTIFKHYETRRELTNQEKELYELTWR